MTLLPTKLYRAEQVRELDRIAIEECGISGYELMNRAGHSAFQQLKKKYPQYLSVVVFCGAGNNAGDGYVVARLALLAGYSVRVYSVAPVDKLQGDALNAYQDYTRLDGETLVYQKGMNCTVGLVVDALLGTGLDREVSGIYANAIDSINNVQQPVIALDIPSGLNADTGGIMGCVVRATDTVTFIGLKQGLFTGAAADYCGEICFSSLAVPDDIYHQIPASSIRLTNTAIPKRSRCAHKGSNGHVLVIGGAKGYSGAAKMAAEAAARVGAGLVSVATKDAHSGYLNINRPELMCHGVESIQQLAPLLKKATVIAVGPGLGQSQWAAELLQAAIVANKPMIIDADGLNLLSLSVQKCDNWVLTPHPGEAATLLQCTTADIQQDRFAAVAAIQKKYHGISVLKGAGSLLNDGNDIFIATTGNPGMASGGFGDVLTGVIAGLIAQGMENAAAAKLALMMHGEAADIAAKQGERGLLASDLMPILRQLVNRI